MSEKHTEITDDKSEILHLRAKIEEEIDQIKKVLPKRVPRKAINSFEEAYSRADLMKDDELREKFRHILSILSSKDG